MTTLKDKLRNAYEERKSKREELSEMSFFSQMQRFYKARNTEVEVTYKNSFQQASGYSFTSL
jgi:hypothetical protein